MEGGTGRGERERETVLLCFISLFVSEACIFSFLLSRQLKRPEMGPQRERERERERDEDINGKQFPVTTSAMF